MNVGGRQPTSNMSSKHSYKLAFLISISVEGVLSFLENQQRFSIYDLGKFNGKNGNPAHIAYKGKVYDVTDSGQWTGGDHLGHEAGQDLTMALDIAPHGDEVMEKVKLVGVLSES
jgi:predicted heme/steroid binding protein